MDQKYAIEKISNLTELDVKEREDLVDTLISAGIERLCDNIVDLASQKAALLAACKLITGLMGNLSLDQVEEVNGINDGRLRAGQLRSAIEIALSAIEQAGEGV